ncbi:hypothetical protein G6L37_27580 [Agrobacterium rubi]|uniref:Uncharacterized protein n=1 Tax=Agrobacterium rubi TR3 = NBRC 13261 TaxID=1368415 RepID=A0A081D1Q4_9HYPH|nr:hypothetical protein [Agrobacterium rubi]MBP1881201.1 hypothetical protein [Agrobacterium rubi]MCL6655601.1 hypothetical protein [Agrobacterium rubi]NTF09268.1 hypothetical protein [Agrobacterium rubi]NTF22177.1 hypothetical protein [Agrobacterium rubi]NTF29034.1 hypothetical protein [Agrobacterium rubi]
MNRKVVIVMVDVPPTTAIHATDQLVEPRQPNDMRIVEEVAAEVEAISDIRAAAKSIILGLNIIERCANGHSFPESCQVSDR